MGGSKGNDKCDEANECSASCHVQIVRQRLDSPRYELPHPLLNAENQEFLDKWQEITADH
jgi:hypothetical protein